MNNTSHRNVSEGQAIAGTYGCIIAGKQPGTCRNIPRCDDVSALTISVFEQGEIGRPVWIVFQSLNHGRNSIFISFEVYQPVLLFVAATDMPGGDSTIAVTSAMPVLGLHEGFIWRPFVKVRIDHLDDKSSAW
jgi:hypothetical protein|tara:strand:+ start:12264 stop:12662 length:399 start_codon:yes stop_codon:yes gene_type:complete